MVIEKLMFTLRNMEETPLPENVRDESSAMRMQSRSDLHKAKLSVNIKRSK